MRRFAAVIATIAFAAPALAQVSNPGVQGPTSSTSGHIATFNGTTGKIIQDGGATPTSSPCSAFGTTTGTCLQGAGALGTPASGNATNLTSIPVNQATGALPVANGGSGGTLGGGKPYFRVIRITSGFSISTATVIQYNSTIVDTGSYWDGTNFRYTPLIAGHYLFYTCNLFNGSGTSGAYENDIYFYLSGTRVTIYGADPITTTSANQGSICYSFDALLNGSTDYVDVRATSTGTSETVTAGTASSQTTFFGGYWLGPT